MAKIVNPLVIVSGGVLGTQTFTNNGTYTPTSIGQSVDGWDEITVNVSSPTPTGKYVDFYDGYGQLLHHIDTSELPLSELPELQDAITGYTFSWSKSLAQVNAMTNGGIVGTLVDVSANTPTKLYVREDGIGNGTSIYIELGKIGEGGTDASVSVDWGDDSSTSYTVMSGSELAMHTYSTNSKNPISISILNNVDINVSFGVSFGGSLGDNRIVKIDIGSNVKFWANSFGSCGELEKVLFNNSCLTNCTLDSDTINLFNNCYSLKCVSFPNMDSSITTLSGSAFNNCYNLENVLFVGTNNVTQTSVSGSAGTFNKCASLKTLLLPTGLSTYANYTFSGSGLMDATINNASSIGTSLFSSCSGLESVEINGTATSLGSNSFYGCYKLKSVKLPSTITSIGSNAFEECRSLKEIELSSNVTSIGSSAFRNCSSLTSLIVRATTPPTLGSSAIPTTNNIGVFIKVPSASVSAYQGASGWSSYASKIIGIEE